MIDLWIEGYAVTGDSITASHLGTFEADNIDEAILRYEAETGEKVERYEGDNAKRSKYGIWACRIFDNEEDARKGFS